MKQTQKPAFVEKGGRGEKKQQNTKTVHRRAHVSVLSFPVFLLFSSARHKPTLTKTRRYTPLATPCGRATYFPAWLGPNHSPLQKHADTHL